MTSVRIATRRSRLALWQADWVKKQLLQDHPKLECELVEITSQGDRYQDAALADYGGKGLFTKALDDALLDNEADIAVHSLKDIPAEEPDELVIAAYLEREQPNDVWVSHQYASIADLPAGALVGTASLRRQCLLRSLRPDVRVDVLRGNVDTRLRKLDDGQFDGLILACAGLKRLGFEERIRQHLTPESGFLPAIGQGVVAVQCRADDPDTQKLVQSLDHTNTRQCALAERAFNAALEGGCHLPIAAYAQFRGTMIFLAGLIGSLEGTPIISGWKSGSAGHAMAIGRELAEELLEHGGGQILEPYQS